jgi:hypothetical protein
VFDWYLAIFVQVPGRSGADDQQDRYEDGPKTFTFLHEDSAVSARPCADIGNRCS